jgi:hypothetical protein
MDFHLNSEQKAFAEAVSKFAEKELAPGALERAHSPKYPWAIAQKISSQGLLGITFPEKDGGMGGTLMDAVYDEKITPRKASDLLQYAGKNLTATEGSFKKGGMAMDESMAHENKESKKKESKETRLEKKGYQETKSGKMVKELKKGGMVRGYGAAIKGKNFKGIF